MNQYIFVVATLLLVIQLVFSFNISVKWMIENTEQFIKTPVYFFIWVAMIETIPIILIVFGMMNITPVQTMEELHTPGLIILLLMGFAIFFIFLQRTFDVTDDMKHSLHQFA